MQIPTIPDRPSPTSVDVFSLLCSQSSALHGVVMRLQNARAELAPVEGDGWRGPAESAQASVVRQLVVLTDSVVTMVESARQHTGTAIWGMSDVG